MQNLWRKKRVEKIGVAIPNWKVEQWKLIVGFLKDSGFQVEEFPPESDDVFSSQFDVFIGDFFSVEKWKGKFKSKAGFLCVVEFDCYCANSWMERSFYQFFPPPKNAFLTYPFGFVQIRDKIEKMVTTLKFF